MENAAVNNNDTFIRFREIDGNLTPAEKKAADFILENRDEVIHWSITDLAQKSSSSESTIVRLCKKLRLKGYQELRVFLAQEIVSPVKQIHEEINITDGAVEIQKKVFQAASQALADTEQILPAENIENAIQTLLHSNSISFFGIGASGVIATDAFYRFSKLGIPCHVATDAHSQVNKSILLNERDTVIAISHSGKTRDVIRAIDTAKKQGARIISVTQFSHSPIIELADIVLYTSSKETAFRSEAMASRIAQLAIIDSLFVGVALSRYEEVIKNLEKSRESMRGMRINHIREL